jgi:hypothetical protein
MPLLPETNFADPQAAEPAVHYRRIHPLAVVSVVLGVLSITTAITWHLLLVPLTGILLGWRALKQIRHAPNEWTGLELAWWGIGLSLGLWLLGTYVEWVRGTSQVPAGYQAVKYEALQPDPLKPTEPIPQSALEMRDKKVYVRGYMQAGRRSAGITDFVLCPSNGNCPFCNPTPKRTEKIRVMLAAGATTVYTTQEIGVAGRFQVDPDEQVPYALEADLIN